MDSFLLIANLAVTIASPPYLRAKYKVTFETSSGIALVFQEKIALNSVKHFELYGPLFFGSVMAFNEKFDVLEDPTQVVIDFKDSRVMDMSGIEALNKLTERYKKVNKELRLGHLSPDCRQLLRNVESVIEVNVLEDPDYKVAVEKL